MSSKPDQLDVITLGETMMAFESQDYGPLREIAHFRKWIGGAEDNFAIGLARLGFRCGWISRLGNDEFGKETFRTIKGEGIDVSQVTIDEDRSTGVFFVEKRAEGDFRCYYYRQNSAATLLGPDYIKPAYIQSAKMIYLTGITPAISGSAMQACEKMIRIAQDHSKVILFDPNLRLKMWSIEAARRRLLPLMRQSTYVLSGDTEIQQLMNCSTLDAAIQKAHKRGIHNLIVKRAAMGAIIAVDQARHVDVPAFAVSKPLSSMGAGDCFGAGFTAGLLKNQPLTECVRWGNAMGAYCMMGWGPYQTLPDMEELQTFLKGTETVSR